MTARVLRADARRLPLADSSVDLICTSPPYFALRSYTDGGKHYAGQVGDEATPQAFLDSLIECTAEWMRVLKPGGSLWVNLGDTYAGSGKPYKGTPGTTGSAIPGVRAKSLTGIPWRYALRCIDELGLILRAEVIWSKPNGLPESVTDRVRRSHEQWFHFTLQPRYYSAVDEVREAHETPGVGGPRRHTGAAFASTGKVGSADGSSHTDGNPLGKLPGSVWTVPTAPLKVPAHLGVDHFAAYPPDLIRRIILGWSPRDVCSACGEGRRPVAEAARPPLDLAWRSRQGMERDGTNGLGASSLGSPAEDRHRTIIGYACACPDTTAPATPGVVFDPFGGTGTTALVASCHGRTGLSVDLSHDYSRLARWRTTDPGERARALHVDKPPPVPTGQGDLFTLEELA